MMIPSPWMVQLIATVVVVTVTVDAFHGLGLPRRIMHHNSNYHHGTRITRRCAASEAAASLLPDPLPNSIGNFFENKTDGMSFIQCYMMSVGTVQGIQYGVGFPVDMPVMLTYFEGNELKPVQPDYPDYDHLMNHVAVQLDSNEFQLYRTPVVLTLQGEFEDDDFNEVIPGQRTGRGRRDDDDEEEEEEEEEEYEDDDGEEGREVSVEELIATEGIDDEEYDDEEDDDEYDDDDDDVLGDDEEMIDDEPEAADNARMDSFWSSSPAGKLDDKYAKMADYTIVRPENPDVSDIPPDAFVTDEDTKSLRKAHRRADRIIEYAADVKLIASFHYRKKNFHLVRLLEPIFIVGRRIDDIKGYYFTLLDEGESAAVTPVLERLLAERSKGGSKGVGPAKADRGSRGRGGGRGGGTGSGSGSSSGSGSGSGSGRGGTDTSVEVDEDGRGAGAGLSASRKRSRRRWTSRPKE